MISQVIPSVFLPYAQLSGWAQVIMYFATKAKVRMLLLTY